MDYIDINQLQEQQLNKRLISESTSLEQAQLATKHTRTFEYGLVTEQQLRDEMTYTMMNCSPCEIKEK